VVAWNDMWRHGTASKKHILSLNEKNMSCGMVGMDLHVVACKWHVIACNGMHGFK
jgi:hypothetical protein